MSTPLASAWISAAAGGTELGCCCFAVAAAPAGRGLLDQPMPQRPPPAHAAWAVGWAFVLVELPLGAFRWSAALRPTPPWRWWGSLMIG